MYRIIRVSDGAEIGVTDDLVFIRYGNSGCFVPTEHDLAIGVAYGGVAYNLVGFSEIEDAETVVVSKFDTAEIVKEMASYSELAAAIREGVNQVD